MPVLARIDVSVQPQNLNDFEAWWAKNNATRRGQQGFQLSVLGYSPGEPTSYTWIHRWSDEEAFQAYLRGESRQHAMDAGQALFTFRRPGQLYENVHRIGDPAGAANFAFATLSEWTITAGPDVGRSFVESRKEVGELRKRTAQQFLAQSIWRHLGTPSRYLVTQAYTAPVGPSPEVSAFMSANPYTKYTTIPQSTQNLKIVHRIEA